MGRKSLILCFSVLAAMVVGIGVAVAFLYSGTGGGADADEAQVHSDSRYAILPAVPSDAVLVSCFGHTGQAVSGPLAGFPFMKALASGIDGDNLPGLSKSKMALSLHYAGRLQPLYVFEVGKAGADTYETASCLLSFAEDNGLAVEYADCSEMEEELVRKSALVIASPSENLVKSALRHLQRGVSILDAPGFARAALSVSSDDALFIPNGYASKLFPSFLNRGYSSSSSFFASVADWTAGDVSASSAQPFVFDGTVLCDGGAENFITVLETMPSRQSRMDEMIPSYTLFAASLPVKDMDAYISAYQSYKDTRQSLQKYQARQEELADKAGVDPAGFMRRLGVEEMAQATFLVAGKRERVNLMRIGKEDVGLIFTGTDITTLRDYKPQVHNWAYASFAASVFGKFFALADESCFTFMNGWIISGSPAAVKEYVSGRALEYTLKAYLKDAGKPDALSSCHGSFISYLSLTEGVKPSSDIFTADFIQALSPFTDGCDCAAAITSVGNGKKGMKTVTSVCRFEPQKTKAPVFERDTTVVVPKGPFTVRNSGSGKDNLFYQNSHLSLCLQEDGKDLWGIPFKETLCGTAVNVDYYANGKLQIVFGAGSKVYLIDRLGRYVNGFPVDLGKDILLGPQVYDFNGTHKYNIMVLHKDNTLEMYNLKGQKPSSWKGISTGDDETIKGLPERLKAGGKTWWVVRTSIRTLIYPFYGGEPVTSFTGDQMIRPDSALKLLDDGSVEVNCYDGKVRTVKLQ